MPAYPRTVTPATASAIQPSRRMLSLDARRGVGPDGRSVSASTRPQAYSGTRVAQGEALNPALFRPVTDGFHVVAVRVADEPTVVAGVVLRPDARLVEHRRTLRHRGCKEGAHRRPIGGLERAVDFSIRLAAGKRSYPERRAAG